MKYVFQMYPLQCLLVCILVYIVVLTWIYVQSISFFSGVFSKSLSAVWKPEERIHEAASRMTKTMAKLIGSVMVCGVIFILIL